jgi:hypothetical protein
MATKKVIAHFQPQAWISDNAVNIDGAYEFDVTDLIEKMGKEAALEIADSDYGSDELWRDWVADHPDKGHDGPFSVTVEAAIVAYFAE